MKFLNNLSSTKCTTINKNKVITIHNKYFNKPTTFEVQDYCTLRNNNIDAEAFIDFYESKGWMVGKNKMKDWKSAVRTWEKRKDRNNNNNDRSTAHWHKKGQDYGDGTF